MELLQEVVDCGGMVRVEGRGSQLRFGRGGLDSVQDVVSQHTAAQSGGVNSISPVE